MVFSLSRAYSKHISTTSISSLVTAIYSRPHLTRDRCEGSFNTSVSLEAVPVAHHREVSKKIQSNRPQREKRYRKVFTENEHDASLLLLQIANDDTREEKIKLPVKQDITAKKVQYSRLSPINKAFVQQQLLGRISKPENLMWIIFDDSMLKNQNKLILQGSLSRLLATLVKADGKIGGLENNSAGADYIEKVLIKVDQLNFQSSVSPQKTRQHQACLLLTLKFFPPESFQLVQQTFDFWMPRILLNFFRQGVRNKQSSRLRELACDVWEFLHEKIKKVPQFS